jgi:hypothetical protein
MISVAVICAYFGELPGSYEPWIYSCKFNPSIDFLLITDQKIESPYQNVHIINSSFSEVQKLTNRKLNCQVALERPYKLCDLKPLYGIIFAEYLKGYDYWGHCDMDMVFGDIRSFLEKYNLKKYDKFLDLGHLSLYRNTYENNVRFKESGSLCGSWEDVVVDVKGHAFDERNGIYQIFIKNQYPQFDGRIYADISAIYKRFRCALDDKNYDYQAFYWEDGKTYRDYWENKIRKKEEFIYIHFQKRGLSKPTFDINNCNAFYIGPLGFFEKKKDTKLLDVEKINPYKGKLYEKAELWRFNTKNLISKVKRKTKTIFNIGGLSNGKG